MPPLGTHGHTARLPLAEHVIKNAARHRSVTDGTDFPPILIEAGRQPCSVLSARASGRPEGPRRPEASQARLHAYQAVPRFSHLADQGRPSAKTRVCHYAGSGGGWCRPAGRDPRTQLRPTRPWPARRVGIVEDGDQESLRVEDQWPTTSSMVLLGHARGPGDFVCALGVVPSCPVTGLGRISGTADRPLVGTGGPCSRASRRRRVLPVPAHPRGLGGYLAIALVRAGSRGGAAALVAARSRSSSTPDRAMNVIAPLAPKTEYWRSTSMPVAVVTVQPSAHSSGIAAAHTRRWPGGRGAGTPGWRRSRPAARRAGGGRPAIGRCR